MSENIVRFGGDTTARELWQDGPTVETGLSRILSPSNRNFSMVAFEQAKPLLDSELNLLQQSQNKWRADLIRALLSNGFLSLDTITDVNSPRNTLRIANATANVNGWVLTFAGANRTDSYSDIIFPAPPNNGTREDLAFAEVWFEEVAPTGSQEDDDEHVYRNGGVQAGEVTNDIKDTVAGAETSRRIQLRWRLRAVADVNFTNHPAGIDDTAIVKAQGGAEAPVGYAFSKLADGFYRAGDGSTAACASLQCVDGYVYGLPLIQVHRSNQTAYNATDNPYGAPFYGGGTIPSGLYCDVINAQDVTVLYAKAAPYAGGNADAAGVAIMDAMTLGQVNSTELEKWKKQRVQQGEITLYNKFVVSGCVVGAVSGTRNLQVTATGTYAAGNFSRIYADGMVHQIDDVQSAVAAVPQNTDSTAKTYYSYIVRESDAYKVKVGTEVPDDALRLYRIIVPAGDTAADLSKVSFADERRSEPHYTAFYNSVPFATVKLPGYTMPDAPDYAVTLEVESAAGGLDAVGVLQVTEKSNNGFKIAMNGSADDVKIRWTLLNPDA